MTVLYTTHLMEEAQELSNRVAIIDHGGIIASGTQNELMQQVGEEDRLEFKVGNQEVTETLLARLQSEVAGVSKVSFTAAESIVEGSDQIVAGQSVAGQITIFAKQGRTALPLLVRFLDDAGISIQSIEVREPDLEAVFLALTGRALRD